jgi:hypothetical protein
MYAVATIPPQTGLWGSVTAVLNRGNKKPGQFYNAVVDPAGLPVMIAALSFDDVSHATEPLWRNW